MSDNEKLQPAGLGLALLGVILPKAIEWAINLTAEELTKVRKEESSSALRFNLYTFDPLENQYPKWNESFGCLTTITAIFSNGSPQSSLVSKFNYDTYLDLSKHDWSVVNQRLSGNKIQIANGDLWSIFETRIAWSDDGSAFKYVSQFLLIEKLLNGYSKVGQIYTVTIDGPGVSPDATTYAVASIDFGEVGPGKIISPLKFGKGNETGWINRVGMSKNSLLAFISRKSTAGENQVAEYTPVRLSVNNIQTKKPSDGAKFIAAVLKASKEAVGTTISESIVPKDQDAVESAVLDAKIAIAESQVAIDASAEGSSARTLAELKQTKACKALLEINPQAQCP